MFETGVNANGEEGNDFPPLIFAAVHNNLPAVRLALQYRADVSLKTRNHQNTALYYAAGNPEAYDTCKVLLENGANCNERNKQGTTPFLNALAYSSMSAVQLFLDHGADIRTIGKDRKTALHYAAQNPDMDVIRFILDKGFSLKCNDSKDRSPLHYAARSGTSEGCDLLLKRGAMVNKKSKKDDHTPMSLAILSAKDHRDCADKTRIVQILLQCGAKVAEKFDERSILEIAAKEDVHQSVRDVLMQNIVKMQHLKSLRISEDDLQTIQSNNCYKEHYERCFQEIDRMREIEFYDSVPISELFGGRRAILGYLKNKSLVKALKESDYGHECPIYFASLKERFLSEAAKIEYSSRR